MSGEARGVRPFSDSPELDAARAAIEGMPVGTEGQQLPRAFTEAIAAAALVAAADVRLDVLASEAKMKLCHAPSREWPHPPHDWTGPDWANANPVAPLTFGIWRCSGGVPAAVVGGEQHGE